MRSMGSLLRRGSRRRCLSALERSYPAAGLDQRELESVGKGCLGVDI